MAYIDLITEIAESDSTFERVGDDWIGKCLICSAPLRFDARTGGGATIEHIIPRKGGGTDDLLNLGLAHALGLPMRDLLDRPYADILGAPGPGHPDPIAARASLTRSRAAENP